MAHLINGLDLQAAIAGHLKNMNFKIQADEEWDHNNKIDFVINKFPRYPKTTSIGVQVTARCNDEAKRGEFVAKNNPERGNITVADKALYLEIEGNVDINKGGAELVANVLYTFQFDDQFADTRVWGATIQAKTDSISYRFFDPRKHVPVNIPAKPTLTGPVTPLADLKGSAERLAQTLGNGKLALEGKLHTFFTEEGYGFISAQDDSTYFMHVSGVKDTELSGHLDALMKLPGKTSLQYRCLFEDGGKTKADALYKTAKNIRLPLKD
jgi:hypothetical protein